MTTTNGENAIYTEGTIVRIYETSQGPATHGIAGFIASDAVSYDNGCPMQRVEFEHYVGADFVTVTEWVPNNQMRRFKR